MKTLFLILISSVVLFATPKWFFHLNYDKRCEVVGYGMDADLEKAKQDAILDITNSILVSVSSSINISSSDINGRARQNSSSKLQTKSKAVLSGVEFVRTELENGMWYVGAKYDSSPFEVKLKKLLHTQNLQDEKQNKYLQKTWAIKSLNANIGKKLNYELIRKNNLWQLKYDEILIPLTQEDLYKFFANTRGKMVSIKANKKIYRQNDDMYFDVRHKDYGYISILYVEHNGKVGVLLSNKKSLKPFRYPTKESQEVFHVVNPYGKTIRELYVAIYSREPIGLDEFENVSEDLLDESNYNFHKLIEKLNHFDFSTFVIKIKK